MIAFSARSFAIVTTQLSPSDVMTGLVVVAGLAVVKGRVDPMLSGDLKWNKIFMCGGGVVWLDLGRSECK